jgi:hypothetical protein
MGEFTLNSLKFVKFALFCFYSTQIKLNHARIQSEEKDEKLLERDPQGQVSR